MYYGVYGKNGGGVYYSWSKVLGSKPYIKSFKAKKFQTRDEAVEYVIDGLVTEYVVISENQLDTELLATGLNFFYYLNSIRL